jgi:hypothetical protein
MLLEICANMVLTRVLAVRHKTRQHIGQLAKDTGARLKSASEIDQYTDVTVSYFSRLPYCCVEWGSSIAETCRTGEEFK